MYLILLQVLKDPKILLDRSWIIFDVICALLAIYMTLQNIGRFQEDDSETTISYKKYGDAVEGEYPSFSMCFEGNGLYRFNESAIFAAYGIHLSDYEQMLNGKLAFQYEYHISSRRYGKESIPLHYEPRVDLKAHDIFQLPNIVKNTSLVAEDKTQIISFDGGEAMSDERIVEELPFYINFQSLRMFCLTRKDAYTLDSIRSHDSVLLDLSFLDSNPGLKVFIHYPGQLLRSFDTPRLDTPTALDVYRTSLDFKVSGTTLLRKRSVQNDPCRKNIADHDRFLLEVISNDTGCIPPYWIAIIGTTSSLTKCRSPEQFKRVYEVSKDYKKVSSMSEVAPCLDMFTSVSLIKGDLNICEKCIHLEIGYLEKYYEEIMQVKAFGFEDFISGLGGFIGIFLGYSMMQIPELLGIFMAHYCNLW